MPLEPFSATWFGTTVTGAPISMGCREGVLAGLGEVGKRLCPADYRAQPVAMLGRADSAPLDYDRTVTATYGLALDRVLARAEGAAARDLINLIAWLSPNGVDLQFLLETAEDTDSLPDPLSSALTDSVRRGDMLTALRAYSLVSIRHSEEAVTLQAHRLIMAILRDQQKTERDTGWRDLAIRMINKPFPRDVDTHPDTWEMAAVLTPHAVALADSIPLTALPEDRDTAIALDALSNQAGVYLKQRGNFDGAIALFEQSLAISEVTHKDDPPAIARTLSNLAGVLIEDPERWDEAEKHYHRALDIETEHLPADDPGPGTTLSNFASLRRRQERFADAVAMTERAGDIARKVHGEDSLQYAIRLSNLGAIYGDWYRDSGDPAHRRLERAYTTRETVLKKAAVGARNPSMAASYNNLSVLKAGDENWAGAADQMARALRVLLSLDNADHPRAQACREALVTYWQRAGEADKAERLEAGDIGDLTPYVIEIEEEHRQLVAEDPDKRSFGPPSPITGAREL